MKANKGKCNIVGHLNVNGIDHGRVLSLLKLMIMVSLIFPIFALPTPAGAQEVSVPNVVGMTQAAAEAAIFGADLTVGAESVAHHESVPAGSVISQNPVGGMSVAAGSAVALVISDGPAPVTVPNVVGQPQAAAKTAIAGAGLIVGAETFAHSSTVSAGNVISQDPTAGTEVAAGSAVALVISDGPAPVTVPNVVGQPQAAAEAAIAGAGLIVGAESVAHHESVPAGSVISQNPAAGTSVVAGSAVDLVISDGPAPVTVPNVVGQTQAEAEAAIVAADLTVGAESVAHHESVPAGSVISQNPAAGTNVAAGSAVDLVISDGPAPVAMPNVVGQTQAEAEAAITSAGLTVGTVTTANSPTVPVGNVISQDPAAGTEVAAGSTVNLVVSLGTAVPDVVGLSEAAAETALKDAGLTKGTVTTAHSPTVPAGDVISQDPAAGTNVAPGSAVDLVISDGPEPVPVPNLIGLSESAAEAALSDAGLTKGTVTTTPSETVAIGHVISQTPSSGTHVLPESMVDLVLSSGPPVFLMGVQNDPSTGPLVNSLYRIRTDGVVTKIGDLTHRTHGLAFVGSTLYSVEELTLSQTAGTPPNLYTLNPETGATLSTIPLKLLTGEALVGGVGLATEPGTNQLWALLIVASEESTFRRLVTINPANGEATQIAKTHGRFMDLAFDAAGTLYAITDNFTVSGGGEPFPARIYTLNKTTGQATEFLDVSAGAVAGQPNFRESETIGAGFSPDLLYHLSGQHKVTPCCTRNILFESIHLSTKVRTSIPITGPDFFVTTALTLVPPDRGSQTLNDLDGDGKADLVWRNTNDGSTAIWLMNGAVIASSAFPGGVPMVWQIAGVGDVNGDGRADVIWRNQSSGTVAIWLMNGSAITSVGFPGSASLDWSIHGVGDVNGDGKADLIWRNTNDGSTAIWLMNGAVIASSAFPGGVPMVWQIAGVGDVNGDGRADVIWRNQSSGTVAIWLMNGSAIASVGFPGSASLDWNIHGVGDINGDGKADLVWRNTNDGSTAIWLMNGAVIASSGFPAGVPMVWQIAQVGDVDGDGKADVIWRHSSSGTVAIWLMNGFTISSVGFPGSASLDWEIQ